MKIIQNTVRIQKKISNVVKKIWVGPKKVGSVGFPETRHFFFGLSLIALRTNTTVKNAGPVSQTEEGVTISETLSNHRALNCTG